MTYTPQHWQVGPWQVTALSDGFFGLDGGSMWGVVPRTMWERWTPAAEDHTIALALRPFLLERGDVRAVIEVGVGDRWEDKWRSIYHIDQANDLTSTLAACGLAPEEITHVVASHCHFDHVGAQVVLRDGELQPLFPNARHFAPAVEVEVALHPDHVRRASYRPEDVRPVVEAGLMESFGEEQELFPGVRVHPAPGHSDGVSLVTVNEDAEGETAVFWADVVPTTHHIQPAYIMAFDIDVARSFGNRSRWLARAADEGWLGLFYHDIDHGFGRIVRGERKYAFDPVAGEER